MVLDACVRFVLIALRVAATSFFFVFSFFSVVLLRTIYDSFYSLWVLSNRFLFRRVR